MDSVGSMKRVFSGIEIKKNLKMASQKAVMYPLRGIEVVGTASSILKQSRGRDKICSLIQYIADFYYSCHKHSQIGLIKLLFLEGQIKSVIIAGKVRDSMKQGRKIFKFLKYLEQLEKFKKIYKKRDKQHIFFSLLEYLKVICKMFSQFFDNILWGINVGVLSEVVTPDTSKNIKNIKDTFSLIGSILKIIVTHIQYLENDTKEQTLFEEILKVDNRIMLKQENSHQLCLKYLGQREKKRDKRYRLIITLVRIMMLTKRLKIYPLNKLMDGALYSFCGLSITVVETFNQLIEKPMEAKIPINQLKIGSLQDLKYIQTQSVQNFGQQNLNQSNFNGQSSANMNLSQGQQYLVQKLNGQKDQKKQQFSDFQNNKLFNSTSSFPNFVNQLTANISQESDYSDLINKHVDQQFIIQNNKNPQNQKQQQNEYDVCRGLTSSDSDNDDEQNLNDKNIQKRHSKFYQNKKKIIQNSQLLSPSNRRYSQNIQEKIVQQQQIKQNKNNIQRTMSCKDHIFAMADNYNQTIQDLAKQIKNEKNK